MNIVQCRTGNIGIQSKIGQTRKNKTAIVVAIVVKSLLWMLTFCLMSPMLYAETSMGQTQVSAHVNFRIVIPVVLKATTVSNPVKFTIQQRDVDRGYIDLDSASLIIITSNSHQGYSIFVSFNDKLLSSADVKLANQVVHAVKSLNGLKSMHIDSPILQNKSVPVDYRLFLKSDVKPGDYPWPVAIMFSTHLM